MLKPDRKEVWRAAIVIILIAAAYSLRFWNPWENCSYSYIRTLVRTVIYLGILIAWSISVRRRVIHTQVLRLFTAISFLMVFWLLVRTMKYISLGSPDFRRYIWYIYYIPMLFVPLLAFLLAMWIGRPESYRLPAWTKWLYVAAVFLALLVLTNDLHRMVFRVVPGTVDTLEQENGRAFLFYPVFVWRAGGLLMTIRTIFMRSRVPQSNKWLVLPLVPAALLLVYGIAYVADVPEVFVFFGDLPVTESFLVIAILESCLWCGLIPSNTHYAELFRMFDIPAVIVDKDYQTVCVSGVPMGLCPEVQTDGHTAGSQLSGEKVLGKCAAGARLSGGNTLDGHAENVLPSSGLVSGMSVSEEQMRQAEGGTMELGNGLLLKNMPIKDGYILWMEDITGLLALQKELEDVTKELAEEEDILQAEIEMKQKQAVVDMRSRMYDSVTKELAPCFAEIDQLVSVPYQNEEEWEAALRRMCVLGAYIKRRCNLMFLGEEHPQLSSEELTHCLRESLDYIRLYGAVCTLHAGHRKMMPSGQVELAYDLFERVVETVLPTLEAMLVYVDAAPDGLHFHMQVEIQSKPNALMQPKVHSEINTLMKPKVQLKPDALMQPEAGSKANATMEAAVQPERDIAISSAQAPYLVTEAIFSDKEEELRAQGGKAGVEWENGILYVKLFFSEGGGR